MCLHPVKIMWFLIDFLASRNLSTEDHFLIGMDLMKDEDVLIAAYDDSQNVTANFTKNILVRLNKYANFESNPSLKALQGVLC